MPLVSSPRRGEVRGSGMRGQGSRYSATLPPHPTLRATFSPAGRRNRVARPRAQSYSFTQPPFFLPDSMQAVTKATPLTPSSTVG